jgi:hypothetical protein
LQNYWLLTFIFLLFLVKSQAQVQFSAPFQGFEEPILASGLNVEFYEGWLGNEIRTTASRIFIANNRGFQSTRALAVQPLTTFTGEIIINLDLSEIESPMIGFYAHSIQNGTGTRPAILTFATSFDDGATFTPAIQIGNDTSFPNNNLTNYQKYKYGLPEEAAYGKGVKVRIRVSAGAGTGSAARLFMDSFSIIHDPEYVRPYNAQAKDIRINEFMAKPDPVVELPNAEFIELYNTTEHEVNLIGFTISNDVRIATLPAFKIQPKGYLILTSSTNAALFREFGNVIGLTNWPTLKNDGDIIRLKDSKGAIIDQVVYDLSFYNNKEKEKGGWSMELINPYINCSGKNDYTASSNIYGGTPGKTNSVINTVHERIPVHVTTRIISPEHLIITFSKQVEKPEAKDILLNNSQEVKHISLADESSYSFNLFLKDENVLIPGNINSIIVRHIIDCKGITIESIENKFGIGKRADFNSLIVTEAMIKPTPMVGLPDAQYVEIYNSTSNIISLKDLQLADDRAKTNLPDENIFPGEYIILCPRSKEAELQPFGKTIGLSNWPTFNITTDQINIMRGEEYIFNVTYQESWMKNNEKQKGGWSLEMIDQRNPCQEESNWRASIDTEGGTPGKINSVKADKIDMTAPEILKAMAINQNVVILKLNEKVPQLSQDQVKIDNDIIIKSIELKSPSLQEVILNLNNDLKPKTTYTITIGQLKDCNGNVRQSSQVQFVLPEKSEKRDIVINEVLSNPRSGGVKFVEINNASNKFINLKNWKLANKSNGINANYRTITSDDFIIDPGAFLAISPNSDVLLNEYPKTRFENLYQIISLPSYPIAEGNVVIVNDEDQVIDEFYYHESFHHGLLRDSKGVSLERVSALANTNDKNNWKSAAAFVNYATPGMKNSQTLPERLLNSEISVEPKLFAPDIIGFNDFTTISYNFQNAGNIADVFITDAMGKPTKSICSNQLLGKEGFFTWDGTDDNRSRVRTGYYIVFFKIFDLEGNSRLLKEKVVIGGRF